MRGTKWLLAFIVAANAMTAWTPGAGAAGVERPPVPNELAPDAAEVAAEGAISEQEAAERAAAFAGLSGEYAVREAKLAYRQVDFYMNERHYPDPYHHGPAQWTLTFAKDDESPYWEVRLDAKTGSLLYLAKYDPSHRPVEPVWPRITYAEARKIAEMFVERINPELKPELQDDAGNYVYDRRFDISSEERTIDVFRFQYCRVANGIPFPQNGIIVNVDVDGNIVYYNLIWDRNYVFEQPEKAFGPEEAERRFREHIALSYVFPQLTDDHSPLLIYEQWPDDKLEASSGTMLGVYDRPAPVWSDQPLTDQPLEGRAERRTAPFTEEEAASRLKALLGMDGRAVKQGQPMSMPLGDVSQFQFDLGEYGSVSAFFNDQTGLMTDFYRGEPAQPGAAAITREAAERTAEQFLRQVAPFALHRLVLLQYDPILWPRYTDTGTNYMFHYGLSVGGVKVDQGAVAIQISKTTGNVVAYSGGILDYPFPDRLPKVIPAQQAQDEIFARNRLERIYYAPSDKRCNDSVDGQAALACAWDTDPFAEKTVKLFYRWAWNKQLNFGWLDAQTGAWLRSGTREKLEPPKAEAEVEAGASGEKTRSVYVEADRTYIRTEPPDPPRIPNRRGKHWIKIRTWEGDKWIHEETLESFVPRLPVFVTLLEDTPIYSGPDESMGPTAVLAPQDVLIADAEPDWFVHSGTEFEGAKSWLKIKSPVFGEQWVHLEQYKIGVVEPMDSTAYISAEPLYDFPYTINGTRSGEIANRTVRLKAQFISVLRRSYQAETETGPKWILFGNSEYHPIVPADEQVALRAPTPLFPAPRFPWPVTGGEKLLQPQTVAAFEKLEDNGTWFHVRTSEGTGWINKAFADPEGAVPTGETLELAAETRLYIYPAGHVPLNDEKLAPQKVKAYEKWVDPATGQIWYHIETTFVGKAWIMAGGS